MNKVARHRFPSFGIASILSPIAGLAAGLLMAGGGGVVSTGFIVMLFAGFGTVIIGGGTAIASFVRKERMPVLAIIGGLASIAPFIYLLGALIIFKTGH